MITPRILAVEIRDRTGVRYHPSSARRLMREQNMSPKTPELVHKSKADVDTIRRWQRNAKRQVSRLEGEGFTTVIQDESIFVDAPIVGRKYRPAVGTPIMVTYRGNRRRTVAYGAIATDGRRFFRTYDKFDGPTFLRYLKELCSHFGKVLVIIPARRGDSSQPRRGTAKVIQLARAHKRRPDIAGPTDVATSVYGSFVGDMSPCGGLGSPAGSRPDCDLSASSLIPLLMPGLDHLPDLAQIATPAAAAAAPTAAI